MTAAAWLARKADGVELAVKVTPRAGGDAIAGMTVDAAGAGWLAVKVTAPPDAGRANDAVLKLLAKAFGVPVSSCRIAAGAGSRWKRVRVAGDPAALALRSAALAAPPAGH